ncbi:MULTISPECIES: FAD-dependent oxidoreductase [Sphingomonas]|uniref:FAD-dependent oxidoreductase n=1 Tax=Sphingomonas TaxID=13687 RepID=UPI00104D95EC|nr:FAD-dependent oxidoreductase [Sphingomonas sp. PP-F2F-A104-K0414]TCP95906.1 Rieske-like 2Fe-2S protein [Sphingomonas sp. PP-F2F-A104-K0414]
MATIDLGKGMPAADLHDDKPVAGSFGSEDVILVRHRGKVCAFAGKCTHQGAPLETGLVIDGTVRCPWHHARFSLNDGEAVAAPAFAPLDTFTVVEKDGVVTITGKEEQTRATPSTRSIGKVVIVGGGAAGHACADMLARSGLGGDVTILSDDADAPYDRTAVSKDYLAGDAERDDTALPEPGLGRGPAPNVRTGVAVASIDVEGHAVVTADQDRVPYDVLILATGATPVTPDTVKAADNVFVLRTLADADAVKAAAKDAKRAIVLGASFIGLEAAASLTQAGLSVTVIARDSVPLAKVAGPEVGKFVQALHEEKGVTFHLDCELAQYDGHTAMLDDGTAIEGDLLVVGVGVEPRIDLAKAAGLMIAEKDAGGGVSVDAQLRTSADGIYAIGDIASYADPRLGHPIRVEHWVHAQRQGQWLARSLLGAVTGGYGDTPFFWTGQYDTSLHYVGHVAKPDDRRIEGDVAAGDFAVFLKEDGKEQAVMTCGNHDEIALKKEAAWDAA